MWTVESSSIHRAASGPGRDDAHDGDVGAELVSHPCGQFERPPRMLGAVIGEQQLLHGRSVSFRLDAVDGRRPQSQGGASFRQRQRSEVAFRGSEQPEPIPARAPWHHATMTDQADRYDRIADGYARWWAPFLVPAAMDLLDKLGPQAPGGPPPDPRHRNGYRHARAGRP